MTDDGDLQFVDLVYLRFKFCKTVVIGRWPEVYGEAKRLAAHSTHVEAATGGRFVVA